MRAVIVVYVDREGLDDMIEHILDGSQAKYKPSLTVGASINGVSVPMMDRTGKVLTDEPCP